MTIFLNVLFILVSVVFFSGRLYEILFLMDAETGFLPNGGIVTTPVMMILITLIIICCSVIIFSGGGQSEKKGLPVGVFGFLSAGVLVASAVMNIMWIFQVGGFLGTDIMIIIASFGLVFFGIKGIRGTKKEKIPFVAVMLLPIGLCIDIAFFSVSTLSDTRYLLRAISYITLFAFLIFLFKYVYMPSKRTPALLYGASLANFVVSCAGGLASVVGAAAGGHLVARIALRDGGLALLGLYSLYIAFYIMPSEIFPGQEIKKKGKKKKPAGIEAEEAGSDEFTDVRIYNINKPGIEDDMQDTFDYSREIGKISGRTIQKLVDQKDSLEEGGAVNFNIPQFTDEESLVNIADIDDDSDEDATIYVEPKQKSKKSKTTEPSESKTATGKKIVYKAKK